MQGGRTNYVWRDANRVIKLYSDKAATPLFPNSPELEWRALVNLKGTRLAPEPIDHLKTPMGQLIIYKLEDGQTGYDQIEDVARLLSSVHSSPRPPTLVKAKLGADIISHGMSMIAADSALCARAPVAPPHPDDLCFIHRDPTPANIVQTSSELRLIDWQCPAIGDPLEDICHFLSPGMHTLYGFRPPTAGARKRFLHAYANSDTSDRYFSDGVAFHWRMACYCEWQISNGNTDYLPALEAELRLLDQLRG